MRMGVETKTSLSVRMRRSLLSIPMGFILLKWRFYIEYNVACYILCRNLIDLEL